MGGRAAGRVPQQRGPIAVTALVRADDELQEAEVRVAPLRQFEQVPAGRSAGGVHGQRYLPRLTTESQLEPCGRVVLGERRTLRVVHRQARDVHLVAGPDLVRLRDRIEPLDAHPSRKPGRAKKRDWFSPGAAGAKAGLRQTVARATVRRTRLTPVWRAGDARSPASAA